MAERRAAVLTVSDGVVHGAREDESGRALEEVLSGAGFEVARRAVPDERPEIEAAIRDLSSSSDLVVTTGGTGLGPRDVTPEATRAVIDREVPGLAEAMRAAGRSSTPMADLSRGLAGAVSGTLVLNMPGSPRGAVESLEAVLPALSHALDLLGGDTIHGGDRPAEEPHADDGARGDVTLELARRVERGEPVVLATAVRAHGSPPGGPGRKLLLTERASLVGTLGCSEFDDAASSDAAEVLAARRPALRTYTHELGSIDVYLEPHVARPRLVALAATPVSLWLLRWGRDLGFETVLLEPRGDRITGEHREAADRIATQPDDLPPVDEVHVVHTDHDAPDVAEHLAAFLRAGAGFVGVMGSARHAGPHLEALRGMGVSPRDVERVRTPVGLDVGARTPQEIALSILAGIVAARSGREGGWMDREPEAGG